MSPEIIEISRERFREGAESALRRGMPWKRKLTPVKPGFVKRAFLTALNPFLGDWRQEQRRLIEEREQQIPKRTMTALTRIGQHETGAHAFNLAPATSDANDLHAAVQHVQTLVQNLKLAENPQDSFRAGHRPGISKDAPFIVGTTLGLLDDAKTALRNALDENGLKHLNLDYHEGAPVLQKGGFITLKLSPKNGRLTSADYSAFKAALNTANQAWGVDARLTESLETPEKVVFNLRLDDNVWGKPRTYAHRKTAVTN